MRRPRQEWLLPPSDLVLPDDEIHLWRLSLIQSREQLKFLTCILSQDELVRAGRFLFERHQRRFIASRAGLRVILGRYLNVEPTHLRFRYGPNGKPYLSETIGRDAIQFNLSHAEELTLYAFTRGSELGVDVEHMHLLPDMEELAARFFSAKENQVWRKLPRSQRLEVFFDCWTRKEAFVKAIGSGLAQPLKGIQVSLALDMLAHLEWVQQMPDAPSRWSIQALTPAPGYTAALAYAASGRQCKFWECQLQLALEETQKGLWLLCNRSTNKASS